MDYYTTTALAAIVARLPMPAMGLLDIFYGQEVRSPTEEISFEHVLGKRRATPFCSPLVAGKIVQSQGSRIDTFKPAYVKDRRAINPDRALQRGVGEVIGGDPLLDPSDRELAALTGEMFDQIEMLHMRLELMGADALLDGKVVVDGEGYDAVEVDYGRDAALTKALAGGAQWGEAGVSAYDNVQSWQRLVFSKSGVPVTDIVFGAEAWELYTADPKVEKILRTDLNGNQSEIALIARIGDGALYQGRLGAAGPRLWVYSLEYQDDAGNDQNVIDPYQVIMGSRAPAADNVRYFGAIRDAKAGFQAVPYYAKSWVPEDPAIRQVLMQSAPLTVLKRPNSTFSAKVRA